MAMYSRFCLPLCSLLLGFFAWPLCCQGQQEPVQSESVHLVPVRLPLVGSGDKDIKRTVMKLMEQLSNRDERPLVIFEFTNREGRAAEGTEFERALSLARFLTGGALKGVRTIAYLPESVHGHAVLVVLAIVIRPKPGDGADDAPATQAGEEA